MHWNSVWNERCPICGGAVPEDMPVLEVRARDSEYLRLRVCGKGCAQQVMSRPTQSFTIAERSQQRASSSPVTVAAPPRARAEARRWFSSWKTAAPVLPAR
jgi:hypothetical protein